MPRKYECTIIAHHIILHGYGHWLANDIRGSGSQELRQEKFADLGEVHFGRKAVQPPRELLREYYREARTRLEYSQLWFDDAKRQAIGESIGKVIAKEKYTCWACAVMKNHVHLCIRRHRDDGRAMWHKFADAARQRLRLFADVDDELPVWSNRPYVVFEYTPDDVRRVVKYIEGNLEKEAMPPQTWPFVIAYDGWPYRNT